MNRGYTAPTHLGGYVEHLERCVTEGGVRVIGNLPPRHAKTETICNFIAWGLRARPDLTFGYATYGAALARTKSEKIRGLAKRSGVEIAEGSDRIDEWRTKQGGGLLAAGSSGSWTGHGVDVFIVDDPIKNRIEAESRVYRDRITDWFRDVAYTRLEPGGSIVVNQTRWHKDDLSGYLEGAGEDYTLVRHPAIDGDGNPLWPERYNLDALEKIRRVVGPYTWQSLYQQAPIRRGGSLFESVYSYDRLPAGPCRFAIGVDLAYTAKKRADYSVLVIMAEWPDNPGVYYVIDVVRKQCRAPAFGRELKAAQRDFPGAPMLFLHGGGGESGVGDFLKKDGIRIKMEAAGKLGDKFTRAQPVAALWNVDEDDSGDRPCVLVPRSSCGDECGLDCDEHPPPDWVDAFVDECLDFTGNDGDTDDQVDALVAAQRAFGRTITLGTATR